jgi:hypothetical protein
MEGRTVQPEPERLVRFPNALQRKVGKIGPVTPALLGRAEAALDRLSEHFAGWLAEEVLHLAAVRAAVRIHGFNAETAASLNIRVHELKSLGATLGYPLVTQIAESLCRLIEDEETRLSAPLFLIDAHIDAIAAAIHDGVRTDAHPIGRALVTALHDEVEALG